VLFRSDVSSGTLFIQQRAALPIGKQSVARAFVTEWTDFNIGNASAQTYLEWRPMVVPISIAVPGATGASGFLVPNGGSEFAQLTHVDQAELTEWVRYDTIVGQDLVRNSQTAIDAASVAMVHDLKGGGDTTPKPGGGGSGGGPGNGPGGSTKPAPDFAVSLGLGASAPVNGASASQATVSSDWLPYVGVAEDTNYPLTRATREALQFRGVLGTYPHKHTAGTTVLPVWRVQYADVHAGRPGALDAAFLMDADPNDPGWPVRVQRAYVPGTHTTHAWQATGDPMIAVAVPGATAAPETGFPQPAIYVALQRAAPVPIAAGTVAKNVPGFETRLWSRLVMYPSGERPREIQRAVIGGSLRGGLVPSATVDEFVFGSTQVGGGTTQGNALVGASLVPSRALDEASLDLRVAPKAVRSARGVWYDPNAQFLEQLPKDCGLLRLGDEIVAYDHYDAVTGDVQLAPDGRGLLGTRPQPHEIGETAMFLDAWPVTQLDAQVRESDATLPLEDLAEFPPEGTALIGAELVHYTRFDGRGLGMPRASRDPGKLDQKGGPLFRGRYGTVAAGHAYGVPVIAYPFRYWDRWCERADAPELSYFAFAADQPAAFWRDVFWRAENPVSSGVELGVVQRTRAEVPWDSDPENTPGLAVLWKGSQEEKPIPIGVQSDRIEWRVFVKYSTGAYDPVAGLAHGWKETPRLRALGAEYLAPNLVLRKVDR
jgi:hypothetical protein